MIKAVIFDLDDTLVSEYEYIKSGFSHISEIAAEKYSYIKKAKQLYEKLLCLFEEDRKNVFNRFLEHFDIQYGHEDILSLVKAYRTHIPQINYYSEVIPSINYLREKRIKTGIITDGYAESQRRKLEKLKAYELFDSIIITDELGRDYWKPHPKSFEMMKEFFDIEYDEMIYVGDNPAKDFYISQIYPVKTVRIVRDDAIYTNDNYKDNIREHITVAGLHEIKSFLK